MNYALGYAFGLEHILHNLPLDALKVSRETAQELNGDPNRRVLAGQIFKYCIKLVLDDIVFNGYSFRVPCVGRECYLSMDMQSGDRFISARKYGKWQDVDFLKSNFTGYAIRFNYYTGNTNVSKPVYVNPYYRDMITQKTNEGHVYHDGNIKTINDYYEPVSKEFPIQLSDLKRILNYCWKATCALNFQRGDTLISSRKYDVWFLIGSLTRDSLKHFQYYIKKLYIKFRVQHARSKDEWDGYYYTSLTDAEYEEITSARKSKKVFVLKNKLFFKLFDECNIRSRKLKHIVRIKYVTDLGYSFYKNELKCRPEIILSRPYLKFKDILIENNNYKYI